MGGRGHETRSPLLEPLCKGLRAQRPLLSGPVSTSSAFVIPGRLAFLCPHPRPLPPSLQRLLSPHHLPFHLLPSPQSVPCPLINSLSPQSAPLPQSMSVDPSLIDCPPSSSPPPPSLTISPPSPEPSITLAPRVGLLWTLTPPPPPLCEGVHPAEHVTPEGLCPSRPFSR